MNVLFLPTRKFSQPLYSDRLIGGSRPWSEVQHLKVYVLKACRNRHSHPAIKPYNFLEFFTATSDNPFYLQADGSSRPGSHVGLFRRFR